MNNRSDEDNTQTGCAYPQESKVLGLKKNPWRVEKKEVTQNGLRVLVIDLGKLGGSPAIFLLYLINVLVTEVPNSREVDREKYNGAADNS